MRMMDSDERRRRVRWNICTMLGIILACFGGVSLMFGMRPAFIEVPSKMIGASLILGACLGVITFSATRSEFHRRSFYSIYHFGVDSAHQDRVTQILTSMAISLRDEDERLIALQTSQSRMSREERQDRRRAIDRLEDEYRQLRLAFWKAQAAARKCGFKTLQSWKLYLNEKLVSQL